jgi:hypothetical protein
MVPVVNGLEEKYQDKVEFRRIDANSPTGKSAYQAYSLRGHPGFVMLSPDGTILWTGLGELPAEILEEPIRLALHEQPEQYASDYDSFLANLKSTRISVETGEGVSQPFFTPQGQIIKLNGEDVQVFEYVSKEEAFQEVMQVSADGSSVGTTMITWIDSPHFYQSGKIIVLYIGNTPEMVEILIEVLGPQFAGG